MRAAKTESPAVVCPSMLHIWAAPLDTSLLSGQEREGDPASDDLCVIGTLSNDGQVVGTL